MGSSGSGRFSDYPGSGTGSGGGSAGGGAPGYDDQCTRAFSVELEDVEHSTYFGNHGSVPPVGTELHVVMGQRISAATDSGEIVSNLPTRFNYLAGCLEARFTYTGAVRDSSDGPLVAEVSVDFGSNAPTP